MLRRRVVLRTFASSASSPINQSKRSSVCLSAHSANATQSRRASRRNLLNAAFSGPGLAPESSTNRRKSERAGKNENPSTSDVAPLAALANRVSDAEGSVKSTLGIIRSCWWSCASESKNVGTCQAIRTTTRQPTSLSECPNSDLRTGRVHRTDNCSGATDATIRIPHFLRVEVERIRSTESR
jgi:hypothetical protein